jgi:hypothetical protein
MYIHRRKIDRRCNCLPGDSVIIDDRPEMISGLIPYPNITPVWLNRKDDATHPTVKTIHSLTELF